MKKLLLLLEIKKMIEIKNLYLYIYIFKLKKINKKMS